MSCSGHNRAGTCLCQTSQRTEGHDRGPDTIRVGLGIDGWILPLPETKKSYLNNWIVFQDVDPLSIISFPFSWGVGSVFIVRWMVGYIDGLGKISWEWLSHQD